MYYGDRVILDTRKYDINDVLERYEHGLVLFSQKNAINPKRKNKVIREMIQALSKGIPFPPVYASELQSGKLLVLDKSDRLRYLLEYLAGKCGIFLWDENIVDLNEKKYFYNVQEETPRLARDILHSSLIFYVIDYLNPKYMHMQVGAFVEEWSASQEQSVRNILYKGHGMHLFDELLEDLRYPHSSSPLVQYDLIYFLMFNMVISDFIWKADMDIYEADKYQLLEAAMNELEYVSSSFLEEVLLYFEEANQILDSEMKKNFIRYGNSYELRTKYKCFVGYLIKMNYQESMELLATDRKMREMIENCDMGYTNIKDAVAFLRREFL